MTAVHQEHGHIVSLMPKVQGDQLAVAASIGATTLTVGDVADFDEGGGSVQIAGVVYGYSGVDDETSQVFLTSGLSAAAAVDEPVQVWDDEAEAVVTEYVALVMLDYMTSGDPLEAGVAHELIDLLAEDTRAARGESVTVEWGDDDDLTVVAVHGKVAVPQVATAALVEAGDAYALADSKATEAYVNATATTISQTAANGRSKVTYSASAPGSTANIAGDIWFQKDVATQTVIGQWEGLGGTSWQQVTLNNAVIANLDAGKLVAGSAFTNALSVKTNFTLGDASTNGVIQSYDFAGSSVGVFIDKYGLVAKGGSITGATVTGGLVRTTETDGNFIELTSGLMEWHQGGTSGAIDPTVARFGSTPGVEVRSAGAYKGKLILEGSNSGSSFTKATLTAANVEIVAGVQATVTGGLTVSGGVDATGTGTFHNQLHGNTVYSDVSAGGGTTAASIDDNGKILRTPPSTRRVKENIEAHEVDVDALLGVGVFRFTYTEEVPDVDHDEIQVGLMAEDLAAAGFDQWVVRNRAGEISGIAYERLSVPLLAVAQRQQQQIVDLSTQLAALAADVAALKGTP